MKPYSNIELGGIVDLLERPKKRGLKRILVYHGIPLKKLVPEMAVVCGRRPKSLDTYRNGPIVHVDFQLDCFLRR